MSEQSRQSQATERQGGRLIVLTGPTAVGKGTVETALRKAHPEVWVSVSATTRDPRPGERDGVNYWFISEPEFLRRQEAGEFLETAVVHGMAHYGTPLEPVREHLAGNVPTILEIKKRLIGRGTETPEQQAKRLETAKVELAAEPEFDVTIVNEQVDKAARDLWNVIAQEYGLPQDTD